ncbi:hypothetical protein Ddc_01156 [Ditylenchus destructor]|nr:hypothetical protein Ddc_01156 [Ditylenchus destructor]
MSPPHFLHNLNVHVVHCMDLFQNKLFPVELEKPLEPPASESSKNVRYGEVDAEKLKRVERKQTTSNKNNKDAASTSVNSTQDIQTGSVAIVKATETSVPVANYVEFEDDYCGYSLMKDSDSPKKAKTPVKNKPRNIHIRLGTKVDKYVKDLNGK